MESSVLLELQCLPPIQYFQKLWAYSSVVIERCENYQKGGYRNRCLIAGPQGIQRLSVPLKKGKNEGQSIRKVLISYAEPWQKEHWTSLRSSYSNSPFFNHYQNQLFPVFFKQHEYLFDRNLELLKTLMRCLDLSVDLQFTQAFHPPEYYSGAKSKKSKILDLRNFIHPKEHRRQEDPHFRPVPYPQVFEERHGFLPNLSILDLLFCTGSQAPEILRSTYVP